MFKYFSLWLVGIAVAGCQAIGPAPRHGALMKTARVNGVELPYVEQGQGIPVVFVHGSMTDQRIWDPVRSATAGRFRAIAYTQRYFGPTPWHDGGQLFNQPTHAADLAAFIRGLDAGPVHVVAWSYGGSVATLAAVRYPELFRSLSIHEPTIGSLIASMPDGKAAAADFGSSIARLRSVANSGDTLAATRQFWEFVASLPENGFEREPSTLQQIVLDNARTVPLTLNAPPQPISCEMVKAIKVPVLVTVGANTRPLWAMAGQALKGCVPDGHLVRLPDSNHDAIIRKPDDFSRVLLDFLARR